jgi:hypothetical protein
MAHHSRAVTCPLTPRNDFWHPTGIDRLVVIGGDGSLSGADLLRQEWRRVTQGSGG